MCLCVRVLVYLCPCPCMSLCNYTCKYVGASYRSVFVMQVFAYYSMHMLIDQRVYSFSLYPFAINLHLTKDNEEIPTLLPITTTTTFTIGK